MSWKGMFVVAFATIVVRGLPIEDASAAAKGATEVAPEVLAQSVAETLAQSGVEVIDAVRAQSIEAPENPDFPVDIVFMWLNSSDTDWQVAFTKTLETADGRGKPAFDATDESRFQTKDELKYAMRSIKKNMPWANHVYIVTDGAGPSWVTENTIGVTVVTHREIFKCSKCLPTFNSFAISAVLDSIPNLSEHFVLLEHDMMFGTLIQREDLFDDVGRPLVATDAGRVILKTDPVTVIDNNYASLSDFTGASVPWAARNMDKLLDSRFNRENRKMLLHQPYPITKTLYERVREIYGADIDATITHQFRSTKDVLPTALALWTGIYERRAVTRKRVASASEIYLTDDMPANENSLRELLESPPKFITLNDVTTTGATSAIDIMKTKYLLTLYPDSEEVSLAGWI